MYDFTDYLRMISPIGFDFTDKPDASTKSYVFKNTIYVDQTAD